MVPSRSPRRRSSARPRPIKEAPRSFGAERGSRSAKSSRSKRPNTCGATPSRPDDDTLRRGYPMMRTSLPVACVLLLAVTARADDAADIKKVLDDQVVAWNKGDLAAFMKGYWNSKELTFVSGKDVTRGWQDTLDRYKKRYQSEGKEMGKLAS